jgi:hypothetical protein
MRPQRSKETKQDAKKKRSLVTHGTNASKAKGGTAKQTTPLMLVAVQAENSNHQPSAKPSGWSLNRWSYGREKTQKTQKRCDAAAAEFEHESAADFVQLSSRFFAPFAFALGLVAAIHSPVLASLGQAKPEEGGRAGLELIQAIVTSFEVSC